MDTLVQYCIEAFKKLHAFLQGPTPALSKMKISEKTNEAASDHPISSQQVIEERFRWIDKMIRLVPNFLHSHTYGDCGFLDYFYFHYIAEQKAVLFRVSHCNCGACDDDLNEHRILGKLPETDWKTFWPIALGRLQYLHKHSTEKRFLGCVSIGSHPNMEGYQVESHMKPIVIMWNLKPSPAPILNCGTLPNFETAPISSTFH